MSAPLEAPAVSRRDWLWIVALFAAVFLAYQPAWRAGFVWDDPAHVTRPSLRSVEGLARIWFEPSATQQYYPLLHSAFWLEHRLFGGNATGYHLVNIGLHALDALLLALILRRLRVSGAALAVGIFALHPVMVESVAWVSELKNVLSALFYFSATLAYLRFDDTRSPRAYALALVLFALGLASKTVVATLPGALLVIAWWRRGRLAWRRDVLPVVPFVAVAAAAGLFTAAVEHRMLAEEGLAYDLSPVQRGLIAGRALCFYVVKLFWPANLTFIYPRWSIDPSAAWQCLFPAAVLLALAGLWRLRGRTRAPLAGALYFAGTLFPALGFVNLFPFIYSFVADHFQYLASLGVIVPVAAGLSRLAQRWSWSAWSRGAGAALLLTLGMLTRRQSAAYRNAVTLYEATLARNPACWFAHNNLGALLLDAGKLDEAVTHFRLARELDPENAAAHLNLGNAAIKAGQPDEAAAHFAAAARLRPDDSTVQNRLGAALLEAKRFLEAIQPLETAIRLRPDFANAHLNLAIALVRVGRAPEAIAHLRIVQHLEPARADARENLRALEASQRAVRARN